MTDQGGSSRHPAGRKVTQIPVPENLSEPISAQHGFIGHPILDPVRGAALTAAVELYGEIEKDDTLDHAATQVVVIARTFERYLTGEEAHGES